MENSPSKVLELNMDDPQACKMAERMDLAARQDSDMFRRHMSDPGAFPIPERLEKQRLELPIPDQAFQYAAGFSRVLLWPVEEYSLKKTDSNLVLPQAYADGRRARSPRGVLISAGLDALDSMWHHGYELGDIVWCLRFNPNRIEVQIETKTIEIRILDIGDIVVNESLAERLKAKEVEYECDEGDNRIKGRGAAQDKATPPPKEDY